MSIGKRIRELRESKGLTQSQLAELLGVTKSAVGNYELDLSGPKESVLYKLIDVLNCDANYLFQDGINIKKKDFNISPKEQDHIKKYRALDEHGKDMVDTVLQKEYERRTEHAKEFIMLQPPLLVPYYGHVASAGNGQYVFDDIPPEMIEIENEMDNMHVDFAIGVNGDSMEPTYHDGDTLLIKKQSDINTGEIGIFMINGEAFVKELGDGVLISHNKKYKGIDITSDTRCIGKVIGKT